MPGSFVADQNVDFPVSACTPAFAWVRYAFWRSRAGTLTRQPGQDFLAWKFDGSRLVFTVCDGLDSSFAGQIAARFLGEKLVDWLWRLDAGQAQSDESLRAGLKAQLNEWRPAGQQLVDAYPLPDGLPQPARDDLEILRKSHGSETAFVCGRIDAQPGGGCQAAFAWVGDLFLKIYDDQGQSISLPYKRQKTGGWSTLNGLKGRLEFRNCDVSQKIGRILAYSDGLNRAGERLSAMIDQDIQRAIEESVCAPQSDDISVIDIHLRDEAERATGEAADGSHFQPNLGIIELRLAGSRLEWDAPAEVIYSVLEEQQAAASWTVYVGPDRQWVIPDDPMHREYRVCAVSPSGYRYSEWVKVGSGEDARPAKDTEPGSKEIVPEAAQPQAEGLGEVRLAPVENHETPRPGISLDIEHHPPDKDFSGSPFPLPLNAEPQPSKVWVSEEAVKILVNRGSQPGEYLVEWNTLADIQQYEVQEIHNDRENLFVQTGTKLELQNPAPGFHTYRVRGVTGRKPVDWEALENARLYVPERIVAAPENVRLISDKNGNLSIHWKLLKSKEIEEYRVYELFENKRELMGKTEYEDQCVIQAGSPPVIRSFAVCAANWSGEGPASKPAVLDPTPRQNLLAALIKRIRSARQARQKPVVTRTPPEPETFRCRTREDVCLEVTRRLKKSGFRMAGLQVEAKREGTDEFRSIDHRKTTELISVYLEKGPDYRLIIFGSQGEEWVIPITFDRKTWNYILTFGAITKKK